MAATREQIVTAVLTALSGITANGQGLISIGRRLRDPENVGSEDRPALFVVEHMDVWERPAPQSPAIRKMTLWLLLYTDVASITGSTTTAANEQVIPSTQVNQFMESIEAVLAPDNPLLGRFTLGGLVYSCMLKGNGVRASGDTTGKSLCAMPIEIILP